MKDFNVIFFFLCIFTFNVFSQISIESVTTDTIDLFGKDQLTPKINTKAALWSTLLIPGLGHQIVGKPYSALRYISIDVISFFGAILFNKYHYNLKSNYQSFAAHYAGISSNIPDDFYWEVIGNFNDYHDYHETLDLVREPEHRFIEEEYFWMWEDSLFRSEYVSIQKKSKSIRTISSFFIGAIILNRIIAFIDIRSTIKNNRILNVSNASFKPYFCESSANGLVLSTEF